MNGKKAEESDIFKLVRMIMQRKFDPVPPCLLFITSFGMMGVKHTQCILRLCHARKFGAAWIAKTDHMRLQVIVFSFSKKECEALALQMAPLDLNDDSEHKLVEGVFWNAVDSLSEDDRRLPQVVQGSGRLPSIPKRCSSTVCTQDKNIDVLLYGASPRGVPLRQC